MPPSCITNRRVTRNITRPVNPHDHTCRGPRANGGARYYIRVEGSASAFTASEGGKLSQGFHKSARAARAHDPEAYFHAWFDGNEKDALCERQGKKTSRARKSIVLDAPVPAPGQSGSFFRGQGFRQGPTYILSPSRKTSAVRPVHMARPVRGPERVRAHSVRRSFLIPKSHVRTTEDFLTDRQTFSL